MVCGGQRIDDDDGWSQGDDDGSECCRLVEFRVLTARKPVGPQEWAVVCTNFGSLTLGLAASVESKNARSNMKKLACV